VLARLDRIQLTTPDPDAVATAWRRLLDAEELRQDRVGALGARRTVLAVGRSELEVLAPDGAGPVSEHLASTGGGLFAAGLAAPDLPALKQHLEHDGVALVAHGGQLFVEPGALGIPGLRVVLSSQAARVRVGLLSHLYEATLLVGDADVQADAIAKRFGLDRQVFEPIRSETFGYAGWLTLFHPDRLDRIETITPEDAKKTMGRFFAKRGPCLYMCYGESDATAKIRERALEHVPGDWTGPQEEPVPDNLFLHPRALGGVMLGVSRPTHAWSWSGHPERVSPAPTDGP
jgi:hypothetical protein